MISVEEKFYTAPIKITPLRRVFIFILTPILKSLAKIQVDSIENLPMKGGAILAINHLSFFDGFVIQYAIPRPIFFMSKAENFQNPFLRFFMHQIGAFPVQRGLFDRSALIQARRILQSGQCLGMFPEGTRTYGQGLLKAKTGTAHLAMQVKCPIVPIAMDGTYRILKRFFHRAEVKVKICSPIYPEDKQNAEQLTEKIMRTIASELPQNLRGDYS